MGLQQSHIDRYHRDGFLVLEGLFDSATLAEMRARLALLPGGGETGVFVGVTGCDPWFRRVQSDPRLVDALTALVGPDLEFLSDKLVMKSATVDFASPWHQDWPYWRGAHKVSVWIALDDATIENGCLRLLPGSHRRLLEHGGIQDGPGFVNRIAPDQLDESRAIDAEMQAGSALIFSDLAVHSSRPNRSGKSRRSLISTYRNAAIDDLAYPSFAGAFLVSGQRSGRDLVPVELCEPEGSVRIWVGDVAVEVDASSSPEAVRVAVQGLSGLR